MAYSILSQSGQTTYGVTNYIVNEDDDVSTVPTDVASGSTILVIETGTVYMLKVTEDGVKEWAPIGGDNS